MNIDNLDDKCLLQIFRMIVFYRYLYPYGNIRSLDQLSKVCTRWERICELISQNLISLKLHTSRGDKKRHHGFNRFGSNETVDAQNYQHYNCLTDARDHRAFGRVSPSFEWLPNITKLSILNMDISADELMGLLVKWPNVEHLNLVCNVSIYASNGGFWSVLNSLKSLKHLGIAGRWISSKVDLPVLAQLDSFFLDSSNASLLVFLNSLNERKIQRLAIQLDKPDVKIFSKQLAVVRSSIQHKVTHLSFSRFNLPQLEFVCNTFINLTTLDISIQKPMDFIASKLTRLYSLTHLKISGKTDYSSGNYTNDPFDFKSTFRNNEIQVLSIKVLCINMDLNPNTMYRIPLLFPGIQELELNRVHLECDCNVTFCPSSSSSDYDYYDSDCETWLNTGDYNYLKELDIASEFTEYKKDEIFQVELFQEKVLSGTLRQLRQLTKVYDFEFMIRCEPNKHGATYQVHSADLMKNVRG